MASHYFYKIFSMSLVAANSIIAMDSGDLVTSIVGADPRVHLFHRQLEGAKAKEIIPRVTIHNQLCHKIAVLFQHTVGEVACITLVPEQQITLDCKLPLKLMEVQVYGKTREWLTGKTCTGGLYCPENLAGKIDSAVHAAPSKHVSLFVELGGRFFGDGLARRAIGEVLPYKYFLKEWIERNEEPIKDGVPLITLFPQVKYARDLGQAIYPRYILCLPEDPSNYALETAAALFRDYWSNEEHVVGEQQQKILVALVASAYEALKSQHDHQFNELAQKYFSDRESLNDW